eukprot:SAG31_NODE_796_length_12032_cov_21.073242_9_plen_140_part_00
MRGPSRLMPLFAQERHRFRHLFTPQHINNNIHCDESLCLTWPVDDKKIDYTLENIPDGAYEAFVKEQKRYKERYGVSLLKFVVIDSRASLSAVSQHNVFWAALKPIFHAMVSRLVRCQKEHQIAGRRCGAYSSIGIPIF